MLVSLNWLRQYADLDSIFADTPIEDIAHKYSTYTAEVDDIINYDFDPLVIGKILSTDPHPDADSLTVVQVDCGQHGKKQIVCGAANVVNAEYVPVALPGCQLSLEFTIEECALRGVESQGMICGADEIDVSGVKGKSIWELETSFPESDLKKHIGQPLFDLSLPFPLFGGGEGMIQLRNTIFDLDNKFITNRPDLFGILENTREMACMYEKKTHTAFDALYSEAYVGNNDVPVQNAIPELVTGYSLFKYTGVQASQSPLIYDLLLTESGHSVHNVLVDITNMVMMEIAQPMHVFDANTIEGSVTIRMAEQGESFIALDDEEYALTTTDMVIADDVKILALAGIIGGKSSAVSDSTSNILVEAATFDAVTVRATSQRLGVRTDSSIRFEKGQTNTKIISAQKRFLELLTWSGQQPESKGSYCYMAPEEVISLTLEHAYLESKAGLTIDPKKAVDVLNRLGFIVAYTDGIYVVEVPAWRARGDVSIPEDLVEEIARMVGYEHIAAQPLNGELTTVHVDSHVGMQKALSEAFLSEGVHDVYTYTFTNETRQKRFEKNEASWVKVCQPFSEEHTLMRASLFDALFQLTKEHVREHETFGFFEYGAIFNTADTQQQYQCGGILRGYSADEARHILANTLSSFTGSLRVSQGAKSAYIHPNKSGTLMCGEEKVAEYGYIHPSFAQDYKLPSDILVFELFPDEIWLEHYKAYTSLQKYPTIHRELAFVMDEVVTTQDVITTIESANTSIQSVSYLDVYRDEEKVGKGKKSLNFSCEFGKADGTLTDEEAAVIQENIIQSLKKEGIELRS